jgi:hypothetical protein
MPRLFQKNPNVRYLIITALGLLLLLPYVYANSLGDLRKQTVAFEYAFFCAFALYVVAVILILRDAKPLERKWLVMLFAFAILFRAILIFTPPRLSDDMYRYVWDGRVQAQGINPYAHPPNATQLVPLRDTTIYPFMNRKQAVTVYPAGAEIFYALLWRIVPDNVRWFQIAMALGDLLAGALLVLLLRALNLPIQRALIYLWSPLVIFETAHAAHVDGLLLPFLVGAWLMRVKMREAATGALLGASIAIKLVPIILFPALWRVRGETVKRIWILPTAMLFVFFLPYLFYLSQGAGVLGFLPNYFDERFNMGLAGALSYFIERFTSWKPQTIVNGILALTLAVISLYFFLRPARDGERAVHRCIYPIGAFTLLTQNLFPWYALWLVPLVALYLRAGKFGLRFDAWTGWFLFTGLIALAYTFFIQWRVVEWALWAQFVPLYFFLIAPMVWNWWRARRASELDHRNANLRESEQIYANQS